MAAGLLFRFIDIYLPPSLPLAAAGAGGDGSGRESKLYGMEVGGVGKWRTPFRNASSSSLLIPASLRSTRPKLLEELRSPSSSSSAATATATATAAAQLLPLGAWRSGDSRGCCVSAADTATVEGTRGRRHSVRLTFVFLFC